LHLASRISHLASRISQAFKGDFKADDNYYIKAILGGSDGVSDNSGHFAITKRQGGLAVVKPSRGEVVTVKQQYAITFTGSKLAVGDRVDIRLKRDGAAESLLQWFTGKDTDILTIAEGVALQAGALQGSGDVYTWQVPDATNIPDLVDQDDGYISEDYYIEVALSGFDSISGQSDYFHLSGMSVRFTSPTNGAKYEEGANMHVAWETLGLNDAAAMARLELWRSVPLWWDTKVDVSYTQRAYTVFAPTKHVGTGFFGLKVPANLERKGQYYLTIVVDGGLKDESAQFEIVEKKGSITVTEPSNADGCDGWGGPDCERIFVAGSTVAVRWGFTGLTADDPVKIVLHHDNGWFRAVDTTVLAERAANTGAYDWVVPPGMDDSDDYHISVEFADFMFVTSDSAEFELKKASIDVVLPSKGAQVEEGSKLQVTWQSTGMPADATVTITLMDYNFWFWEADDKDHVLAAAAANTGVALVELPKSGIRYEDQYYLQVRWNTDKAVSGDSARFAILERKSTIQLDDCTFVEGSAGCRDRPTSVTFGQVVELTWSTENIPADAVVDIHMYETKGWWLFEGLVADELHSRIARVANTGRKDGREGGRFLWTVPDVELADDYYFEITWTEYPSVQHTSDEFAVVKGKIYVDTYARPKELVGDTFQYFPYTKVHREDLRVGWSLDGIPADNTVTIRLVEYREPRWHYLEFGEDKRVASRYLVAAKVPAGELEYVWNIQPDVTPSPFYAVEVSVDGLNGVSGSSRADTSRNAELSEFVQIQGHKGSIAVHSPRQGHSYAFGEALPIKWTTSADVPEDALLTIKLYEDRWWPFDDREKMVLSESAPNSGGAGGVGAVFEWTIPMDYAVGGDYFVDVAWSEHPTVRAVSDEFAINKESIQVLDSADFQASGGDAVLEGGDVEILWKARGFAAGAKAHIELYRDGFLWFTPSLQHIAKDLDAQAGSYMWSVDKDLPTGSRYYYRVYSADDETVYGESDWFEVKGHPGRITVLYPRREATYVYEGTPGDSKVKHVEIGDEPTFYGGQDVEITWLTSDDIPADAEFTISLYNARFIVADAVHLTIATNAKNTGSYLWEVPPNLDEDDDYFIVITWNEFPSVVGQAVDTTELREGLFGIDALRSVFPSLEKDAYFELKRGQFLLSLDKPKDGTYTEGDSVAITWESRGVKPGELVTLHLYDADFFTADDKHVVIAQSVANTGAVSWKIPGGLPIPDDSFYVGIEWDRDGDAVGESYNFEIVPHPGTITVGAPAKGTKLFPTQVTTISWTSSADVVGTVKLELWRTNMWGTQQRRYGIATGVDAAGGKYEWTVPFNVDNEDDYYVAITWEAHPSVAAYGSKVEISNRNLVVVNAPTYGGQDVFDKGVVAYYGGKLVITWDANKLPESTPMDIVLVDTDSFLGFVGSYDVHQADIAKGAANTGSFTWEIPRSGLELEDTTDFEILVTVAEDGDVWGRTKAAFEIGPPQISTAIIKSNEPKSAVGAQVKVNYLDTVEVSWSTRGLPEGDEMLQAELWDDLVWPFAAKKVVDIGTVAAADGKMSWRPDHRSGLLPNADYFIRLRWAANEGVFDDSPEFEIYHDGPALRVLTPNSETDVIVGQQTKVTWISVDLDPEHVMDLELWDRRDLLSGETEDERLAVLDDSVVNNGAYDWTPTATQLESNPDPDHSTYFIRARWEGAFEGAVSDATVSDSQQFKFAQFSRPGQPRLISGTATSLSIDIEWEGSLFTSGTARGHTYEVQYVAHALSATGNPWKTAPCNVADGCEPSANVRSVAGLVAGLEYRFRVRTVAAAQTSAWSEESERIRTVAASTTVTATTTTTTVKAKGTAKITPQPIETTAGFDATGDGDDRGDGGENGGDNDGDNDAPDGKGDVTTDDDIEDQLKDLKDELDDAKDAEEAVCSECATSTDSSCDERCDEQKSKTKELEDAVAKTEAALESKGKTNAAKQSGGGLIVGVVVGVLLLLALIAVLIVLAMRKERADGRFTDKDIELAAKQGHVNPIYDVTAPGAATAPTARAGIVNNTLYNPLPPGSGGAGLSRSGSVQVKDGNTDALYDIPMATDDDCEA
jgi:hypothetical protein